MFIPFITNKYQSNKTFQSLSAAASKHMAICSFVVLSSDRTGSSSRVNHSLPSVSIFFSNSPSTGSHKINTLQILYA